MILEEEVERIRKVRKRISEECGNDLQRLRQRYQSLARQLRASGQNQLITVVQSPAEEPCPATDKAD